MFWKCDVSLSSRTAAFSRMPSHLFRRRNIGTVRKTTYSRIDVPYTEQWRFYNINTHRRRRERRAIPAAVRPVLPFVLHDMYLLTSITLKSSVPCCLFLPLESCVCSTAWLTEASRTMTCVHSWANTTIIPKGHRHWTTYQYQVWCNRAVDPIIILFHKINSFLVIRFLECQIALCD